MGCVGFLGVFSSKGCGHFNEVSSHLKGVCFFY